MNAHTYNPHNQHPGVLLSIIAKEGWKDEISYLAKVENEQHKRRSLYKGKRYYPVDALLR